MKRNSQLSAVLHLLLHMAERPTPFTSESLAKAMATNPVVVRRMLAGLREHGLVRSEKGHGGGWTLARPLEAITLRQVHAALGGAQLLAVGNRNPTSECLVEQAVNTALDDVFASAEAVLLAGLSALTLAMIRTDFQAALTARGLCEQEVSHAG